MKKQVIKLTEVKSQNRECIVPAFPEAIVKIISTTSANWRRPGEGPNFFLVRTKGKGPPGQVHSYRAASCPGADNPPAILKNNETLFITEFQLFKQIQNPDFINN